MTQKHMLTALCAALFSYGATAQFTLPQPIAQHIPQFPAAVQKHFLPQQDGQHFSANNRSAVLKPDSTKQFINYVEVAGQLDSTPFVRTIFTYPTTSQTISVESGFNNGVWVDSYRVTDQYDAQDRLVEELAEFVDETTGEWALESKLLAYPHGNSATEMDSVIAFAWENEAWVPFLAIRNTYNNAGKLEKSESAINFDGQNITTIEVYMYDGTGRLEVTKKFVSLSGFVLPLGERALTYDQDLVVMAIEYSYPDPGNPAVKEPVLRQFFEYNTNQQITQIETSEYDVVTGGWAVTNTIDYTYDNEDRTATQTTTTIVEGEIQKDRTTYSYVEGENFAVVTLEQAVGVPSAFSLVSKDFYYYNGTSAVHDQPLELAKAVWPNPTSHVLYVDLKKEAVVQVFNSNGQLVNAQVIQPNQPLSMTDLTAGLYLVKINQDAATTTVKVVKQ